MKRNYDKKHNERIYEPGHLVAVWTPVRKIGKCEKLLRKYFGPYRILKKLSNVNYLIEPKDNPGQDPLIVHVSRLKPYFERIDEKPQIENNGLFDDVVQNKPSGILKKSYSNISTEVGRENISIPAINGKRIKKSRKKQVTYIIPRKGLKKSRSQKKARREFLILKNIENDIGKFILEPLYRGNTRGANPMQLLTNMLALVLSECWLYVWNMGRKYLTTSETLESSGDGDAIFLYCSEEIYFYSTRWVKEEAEVVDCPAW
ncbi:hypothetical protein LAZ67_3004552 [Cordylochernes scorpioides]|uniref:Integrase p58-like C-terminal domain-containing protein n=1 Tax=Cordylochernes scorpioides TaxID=51811 RepID=A0ABY6KCX4_9ARAC|nr:hypothetical protein LAZ67_3004552 [Cordylochernes scorpioides]